MKTKLLSAAVLSLSLAAVSVFAAIPHTPPPAAKAAFDRATELAKEKEKQADAAVAAFLEAIEADPEYVAAHDALKTFKYTLYFQAEKDPAQKPAFEKTLATIQNKYREWEKRFPDSPGVMWGIVMQFYWVEDPRAKPYLLKIVARQPDNAEIWFRLSLDAERWGDDAGARDYMAKAMQAEPVNPDYAFYHASALREVSPAKWEAASRELAQRFPTHDRGAQALYWLAQRGTDDAKRIAIWEQARRDFPPAKFNWSRSSMSGLYDAYLRTAPEKAVAVAQEMVALGEDGKAWPPKVAFAEAYRDASALVAAGKFKEAAALLDKLTVDRRSSNPVPTLLLKAKIVAGNGNAQGAYDSLLQQFTATPADELHAALKSYAKQLGKADAQVNADVWAARDAKAKPAPAFDLGLYTSDKSLSLASLRGKVVFVTFWFPGCGPCRGEFPHFENVVTKFKGNPDVVYLGINGMRDQDGYVAPFMAATKYSFIALQGGEVDKVYGVRAYPANFLIDRDGRIIFSDFRTSDPQTELVLQRMIEALLERPARS